ncbi:SapC family protein [Sphingomonas sp. IC-56]|uniref:SapC family protein n=1 Tax=Sphingomonas sp. IC-56 TaxID=2898529 RepID=UPI001E46DA91|nr:SapC family protein [Sphingomonas sp. IC-56]MCD2324390.1 SapC family protein [Sphingomonas sp. IC-56]
MNVEQHAGLRVSQAPDASRHFAQIVADEFIAASHDFPIFFTKHAETGGFYAGVVLGLNPGENLSCVDGRLPGYRPADLERQGFYLVEDRIVINRDHPVFAGSDGERLFDDAGEPGAALRRVQQALGRLQTGLPATDAVIQRLLHHKLLEPIDVNLRFDDGSHIDLDGLYTVSLDRLHALPDAAVLDLFRQGDLQLAYAQASSIIHVRRLARRYNDQLTSAPA